MLALVPFLETTLGCGHVLLGLLWSSSLELSGFSEPHPESCIPIFLPSVVGLSVVSEICRFVLDVQIVFCCELFVRVSWVPSVW